MLLLDLLLHITVPTGRVQLITEVRAAAVLQELTVHLQLLPNREVLINEALPQEVVAAAVTAAVALHLQEVIHRAVRVPAPEAAGHLHLHHHHQAEEDNRMLATILSINKIAI
jgi:hypothetical protein